MAKRSKEGKQGSKKKVVSKSGRYVSPIIMIAILFLISAAIELIKRGRIFIFEFSLLIFSNKYKEDLRDGSIYLKRVK